MGDAHQDNCVADSLATPACVQGATHSSMCNQVAGQDVLQEEPLGEDKASAGVVQVDPSVAKDFPMELEDLHKEASVTIEVDLEGPQDSLLHLN